MITIRSYTDSDAESVGILIADTYSQYNLDFASPRELPKLLGPFAQARSTEPAHRKAIIRVLKAAMLFVAEEDNEIVGVLRGRKERLQSLFVRGTHHRRGIGRKLVEHFEAECLRQGSNKVVLAATLFAVPFYTAMGYKKSTGVRNGWSFEGAGLKYQPMKKVFPV